MDNCRSFGFPKRNRGLVLRDILIDQFGIAFDRTEGGGGVNGGGGEEGSEGKRGERGGGGGGGGC